MGIVPAEALGDELLSAWLDSLMAGLEKFLETSGASAVASGEGYILPPYRTLLMEHSPRMRKLSLSLSAAASSQAVLARARRNSSIAFSDDLGPDASGHDSPNEAPPITAQRSGRTEMHQRHISRFLEKDVLNLRSQRQMLRALLSSMCGMVRSQKWIMWQVHRVAFFAMIYTLLSTPLYVGFQHVPSAGMSLVEVMCDVVLLANVMAPFACGLPDTDSHGWISSSREVFVAYARGWMAIDMVAGVPWHIMWLIRGEKAVLHLSLLRLVLLPKLISQFIFGDSQVLNSSTFMWLHPNLLRAVKLISLFFLVVHLLACGYSYLLATGALSSYAERPSLLVEWTNAYYWALCVVNGESLQPVGYFETMYHSFTIAVGILLHSCIAGSVTALMGKLDEQASRRKAKLDTINSFMSKNGVSPQVCDQVRQYFQYLDKSVASHIDGGIFDELSLSLRLKLNLCIHKRLIQKCHLFAMCPSDCIVGLVNVISRNCVILVPLELLFKKGAPGDGMYFVSKGEVILYDPGCVRDETSIDLLKLQRLRGKTSEGGAQLVEECKAGDCFGEGAVLKESIRQVSATAMTFAELLFLARWDFDKVMVRFPSFVTQLRSRIDRRGSRLSRQGSANTLNIGKISASSTLTNMFNWATKSTYREERVHPAGLFTGRSDEPDDKSTTFSGSPSHQDDMDPQVSNSSEVRPKRATATMTADFRAARVSTLDSPTAGSVAGAAEDVELPALRYYNKCLHLPSNQDATELISPPPPPGQPTALS